MTSKPYVVLLPHGRTVRHTSPTTVFGRNVLRHSNPSQRLCNVASAREKARIVQAVRVWQERGLSQRNALAAATAQGDPPRTLRISFAAPGGGNDLRFSGPGYAGQALVVDRHLVHLAVFP